jgi:hypothetical protein
MPSSTRFRRAPDRVVPIAGGFAAPTCPGDDDGAETSILMFRPRMSPRRCPPTFEEYGGGDRLSRSQAGMWCAVAHKQRGSA